MIFMKKQRFVCCLLLLLLALVFTGCTAGSPSAQGNTAAEKLLMCYGYGSDGTRVFNSEGKLIVKTEPADNADLTLVSDENGNDVGVVEQRRILSEENFNKWGNPATDNTIFTFYDTEGNVVRRVDMQAPGDIECITVDGSLTDCRFFAVTQNEDDELTGYTIYDENGAPLVEKAIAVEREGYVAGSYADMRYNGQLMFVNYDARTEDWSNYESHCDVYEIDGTPKTLAQDYYNVYPVWLRDTQQQGLYLDACYDPTPGTTLIDVLNADGSVLIAGLNEVYEWGNDMVFCRIGTEKVLLDMQGNRLYTESVYTQLDD